MSDRYIWDCLKYDMGDFTIYNVIGSPTTRDHFGKKYTTYALGSSATNCEKESLLRMAHDTIISSAKAVSHEKPQGEMIENRDVYICWRMTPETGKDADSEQEDRLKIVWRMSLHPANPYVRFNELKDHYKYHDNKDNLEYF